MIFLLPNFCSCCFSGGGNPFSRKDRKNVHNKISRQVKMDGLEDGEVPNK